MRISGGGSGNSSAHGYYTGDGTQNRAIAHGLSGTPGFVFLQPTAAAGAIPLVQTAGLAEYHNTDTTMATAVSAPDGSNIYVGGASGASGNVAGKEYYWVAVL